MMKIVPLLLGCALVSLSAPAVVADEVFVFYSRANQDLWETLQPSLGEFEVESYQVDLLALADYSAKQKAIARANRRNVAVVVGPRASSVLADVRLSKPIIAVEVDRKLATTAETTVYLYVGKRPAGMLALPQKIHSATDLEIVSLQTVSAFRVEGGADLGAILAALISRVAAG